MAEKKDIIEGINKELESLEIVLTATAGRTAITLDEYVALRVKQGASLDIIKQDLLDDLNNNGRIFGEFRRAIKATANGSVHRFRDVGQSREHGLEQTFKWAAVLVNTCRDCEERHGIERTYEEWELYGLPRTGHTICKQYCRCMLIPGHMSVIEGENKAPIKRKKRGKK